MTVPSSEERKILWLLAAMQFSHIMDFMVLMPLGPQLMRVMHVSQTQFALLVSIYSFAAAVAGLLLARWADAFPRKTMLLLMFGGFILATFGCALAESYPMLLVARCVAGLFGGVVGGIVQAYVSDLLPPERRGWGMGVIMTAFSLSAVAGVPFGIWLGSHLGWQAPFFFIAAVSLLIAGWAAYSLKPVANRLSEGGGLSEVLCEGRYWLAFAMTLVLVMSGFSVIPHISPFLVNNLGFGEDELAYFYLVGGAATLVTARLIGRLADRLGKFRTFAGVAALSLLPIILLTQMKEGGVPMAVAISIFTLFMILVSGRFIPAMALISLIVPPHLRGRFMSLNVSVQQLGSGLAALVSGAMLDMDGLARLIHYDRVGYLGAGCALLAIGLAWRIENARRRDGVSH